MTTAKLIINGKEIEVQLTDEEIAKFIPKQKTGFERADSGCNFMHITKTGCIMTTIELFCDEDNAVYESGNYYTDKSLAEWCARQETLLRKMRRWAAEHNDPNEEARNYLYARSRESLSYHIEVDGAQPYRAYFTDDVIDEAIEIFGEEYGWLYENRPKIF